MQFQTKALYNLLRLNTSDEDENLEEWQIEDLRLCSDEELFHRFFALEIPLSKEQFLTLGNEFDTPEDMAEALSEDGNNPQKHDQIYLIIFELWRRFLPEKQTLSIFCDELDIQIYLYDQGTVESDENIQDALANLEEILDENVDMGVEPSGAFQSLSEYLAHDLESFIFDYTAEQIDSGYETYAKELLEGFYPYMSDLKWFDFLRATVISSQNSEEANAILRIVVDELKETPDIDLQMEILQFLVHSGDPELFVKLVKMTTNLLQTEEDFSEILEIVAEYYHRLDKEELSQKIEGIMERRTRKAPGSALKKEDPDLDAFTSLVIP